MRRWLLLAGIISGSIQGHAQIFKKHVKPVPSPLDKIRINEHFRTLPLDSVYNFMHATYGLKIEYDTAYCSTVMFDYWFINTVTSLAMEVTTRSNDLKYAIDSEQVIHVATKHIHNVSRKMHNAAPAFAGGATQETKDFTLKGHIVDDSTSELLTGANVTVAGTAIGMISAADGSYMLEHVPSDTVKITVTYQGYLPADVYLTKATNHNDLLIALHHEEHMLDVTTVTATKQDLMKMTAPTMYQVDHLYGFFSAFNANAVKEVDLFKGGFDAKYGGRLSSVTDITGKEGSTRQFNLGGDISLLSANIFTEIPVTDNLSVVAAARRSWNGPIYNWIFNSFNKSSGTSTAQGGGGGRGPGGADGVTKAKSYFYDINTRVTFRPTKKDEFVYSFFNGSDDLNNSFTVNTPSFLAAQGITLNFGTTDVTTYGNTGMSLGWRRKWTEQLSSNTVVSYSNFYSDRNRVTSGFFARPGDTTSSTTGVFEHNNLKDLSLRSDYEWHATRWNHPGFGFFGTGYDIDYTYAHSDTAQLVNSHNTSALAGGYLQDQFLFFNNHVILTPGIRLSYYGITGKSYTEPRLSLAYNISSRWSFKAAYGTYYQFANRITREDISAGSSEFWVLADDKAVPVSSAVHYISGLSYETGKYMFGVEAYYKTLSNITQYTERFTSSTAGITYNQNFYTGTGYSQGVELTAQKKMGAFTGWVSYTLAKTMYHFDVYSSEDFPADQDVRNEFKIVLMYKYKHWDFAATWIYASGKPYTAPGGSYSVKLLDGTTENYVTVTSKNTLRLPDYHRMDASVNYHFYNGQKKDVGYIGLSLFNVYARENVWYKEFTVVDNHVVETNVNYLGFTPNLTLSIKLK